MQPGGRLNELKNKGLCFQCLNPGLKIGHNGFCFNKFNCPHSSHRKFDIGYHVLVFDSHKSDMKNQELLEEYKAKYTTNPNSQHKNFSKNIIISFHVNSKNSSYSLQKENDGNENDLDHAIYMLQTIQGQGKTFKLFFDSGCGDLVCKIRLESMGRINKILDGPLTISGVGDNKTIYQHSVYNLRIPLHNGNDANLSGVCLDKITGEHNLHRAYASMKNDPKKLVGMIGIQYLKYYPKRIFSLPNGLTIYESQF